MKLTHAMAATAVAIAASTTAAHAQTEIQWWHAMGGALGEKVDAIAAGFNATQDDYVVVPTYKGNYTETMTGAIAAFRSGEQPHIVQVFEVGTATMMAAEGAIYPVYQLMGGCRRAVRPLGLPAGGDRLLHHAGRPDAVDAVQQLDAGALLQQGDVRGRGTGFRTIRPTPGRRSRSRPAP